MTTQQDYQRQWYQDHKEQKREYERARRLEPEYRSRRSDATIRAIYHLTLDEYNAMMARGCDACGTKATPGLRGRLQVDHDHLTNRVRGILCGPCNRMLGHAKDDPKALRRVADYIERCD